MNARLRLRGMYKKGGRYENTGYPMTDNCVFCRIVRGELPCHRIWEDDKHLAFLSIFPNTPGFSVVITKVHYGSYAFDVPEAVLTDLIRAARQTALLLDRVFDDVGRTGMIFEGFGVDHLHAKLFPMHGTATAEWRQRKSNIDKYFDQYEGYISSHDWHRADDSSLAALAAKIRQCSVM